MVTTISEAIDYLYVRLRKTTTTISNASKTYYEIDGKKYNAAGLMKLANSTNPSTWLRS